MERIIVRDHLKEAIGNRKVLAALFHTFNFEPRFFENYVMPLFVPSKNFRDEIIHNKILWRYCYKENLIPPIAVYCDYYAKDNTHAPSLGYNIHCIKTPSTTGSICNFHPKHIFILLEDEKENQSLLFVTGSGNLTANGWCDNFEGFSFHEIKKNKTFPNKTTTNSLQDYIAFVSKMAGLKNLLLSDLLIHSFLSYVNQNVIFFNNLQFSFQQFLIENIFSKDEIRTAEIITPFFSKGTNLIEALQAHGIKKIRCLIPTLRNNEIQLEKEVFTEFEKAGLIWCYWADKKNNEEVRNQHSKIYRFYSTENCYTIIGSVNFTKPGWEKYKQRNNKANIETAVLYKESKSRVELLIKSEKLDYSKLQFINKEDIENPSETFVFNRSSPDIEFTIDWKSKTLVIDAAIGAFDCCFHEMLNEKKIEHGISEIQLDKNEEKQLTKNALIKVVVKTKKISYIYIFYPNQINIEKKPLDFKFDANTIVKYWQFFENDFEKEKITRSIAEISTDESGIVDEERLERKLLLNEMATYFSGLINLEKYLFPEKLNGLKKIKNHFQNLLYYLLSENIDTVSFFLIDLKSKYEESTIQKSFYWMVLQILNQVIYSKAEKWEFRSYIDSKEWKTFKVDIKLKREELSQKLSNLVKEIPGLKQKENWVIAQIIAEND